MVINYPTALMPYIIPKITERHETNWFFILVKSLIRLSQKTKGTNCFSLSEVFFLSHWVPSLENLESGLVHYKTRIVNIILTPFIYLITSLLARFFKNI